MKKFLTMMAMAFCLAVGFSSCERIDAGHEGIMVTCMEVTRELTMLPW